MSDFKEKVSHTTKQIGVTIIFIYLSKIFFIKEKTTEIAKKGYTGIKEVIAILFYLIFQTS